MTETDLPVFLADDGDPTAVITSTPAPAEAEPVDPYTELVGKSRRLLADLVANGLLTSGAADVYANRLGLAPLDKFTVNVTVSATVVARVAAVDGEAAVQTARRLVGNGLPAALTIAGFPVRHPLVDEARLAE